MKDTNKIICRLVLDILREKGVRDVVCSPGSRNAPLLLAAEARPELKKHIIIDERSAAFYALGICMVSRLPVALICTSGSAVLNYAPAVAEAYYQGLPLIVVSADRPSEWIDQDDSQTINQFDVLNHIVKQSYDLSDSYCCSSDQLWFANRIINDAMIRALSGKKGPVHINIRLEEPLSSKTDVDSHVPRIINMEESDSFGNKEFYRELAGLLKNKRVMLVAGFMVPDAKLQQSVTDFSKLENVVVFAETLSNLHLNQEDYSIDSVLTALSTDILESLCPDIIISIGGALVSRKLKEFLRNNSNKTQHWVVGKTHTTTDCFKSLALRIDMDPSRFFRVISKILHSRKNEGIATNYKSQWHDFRKKALKAKNSFIECCDWSELKAFKIILNSLVRSANLFVSNGTAVRYAQIIPHPLPHAVYGNRGVSGIEGSVSTAIGASSVTKGSTVLICGDMSMAYDLNSLSLPQAGDAMKLIVIDNQGGGIFRFIPTTSGLEEREKYFCVSPELPLRKIAESFAWKYFEADSEMSLENIIKKFYNIPGKAILNIRVNGEKSAEILKRYMEIKII